jgi:hypothetical protein
VSRFEQESVCFETAGDLARDGGDHTQARAWYWKAAAALRSEGGDAAGEERLERKLQLVGC